MELVALCARPTLNPAHRARLTVLVDEGPDWTRVLDRARVHGVLGLVYHHLVRSGEEEVPPDVRRAMEAFSRRTQVKNLKALQELRRLADLFADADVPLLTFKGPLLAQQYYGNVAFRTFGDIDLLVDRSHLARAQALLEVNGYRIARSLTASEIQGRHDNQLGLEFVHGTSSLVVELHWALLNRTFSFRLDPSDVWARARTVSLGTTQIQTLAPADLVLYLCAHGTKHHWSRLLCVCDVAQVLRAHPRLVDEALIERARRSGGLRVLLLGFRLAERWLGRAVPAPARDALQHDSRIPRLVRDIEERWFGTEAGIHPPANLNTLWFFLRTRERLRDNWAMMGHYLRLALSPTEKDRSVVPARLPAGSDVAPYLVRPLRLLGKGLTQVHSTLVEGARTGTAHVRPALVRRARRGLQALRRRSWAERWDLAVALVAAGLVAGLLHACSFRRVVGLVDRCASSDEAPVRLTEAEEKRLLAAVEAVSRRLLPRRPCLTQALTARLLLGWRGARPTELWIGVAHGPDEGLNAHAWLERDGKVLTGGAASPRVFEPLTSKTRAGNDLRRPADPLVAP